MAHAIFNTSNTWVCPTGVTNVAIWSFGAGGAGGGDNNNVGPGSGGGGGAAAFGNVPVTPGNTYTITVAGAATGSKTATVNGGDSWFSSTGSAPASLSQGVLAKGGLGGVAASATFGTGGAAGSCIGTITMSGGDGAAESTTSGAGGGGAGWQAAGGAGVTTTAGPAGNGGVIGNIPGKGGAGRTGGSQAGAAGVAVGGAGSGAVQGSGGFAGGNGAAGLVVLQYGATPIDLKQVIMAASGGSGVSTSASVSWPAATTAGNLLVAVITLSATGTITPPTGWTLAVATSTIGIAIYYIQNASSKSGAMTFTVPNSRWLLELHEYNGIVTSSALVATANSYSATSTTAATTGASTANPATVNDLVIGAFRCGGNTSLFNSIAATSGSPYVGTNNDATTNSAGVFEIIGGLSTASTETVTATQTSNTMGGALAIFEAVSLSSFIARLPLNINQTINRAGSF